MNQTNEGIQRGHLLLGPIEEEGRLYLWSVTRVNGPHSVSLVTNTGKQTIEIPSFVTKGIVADDNRWNIVVYREEPTKPANANFGGVVIDGSYLRRHGERHADD